ncbi:hypothetical protein GPECTOR_63g42 [Gonium pectorale]|uniref:Uncharacterized protein n=1 Tax=Gonium pectorale TaxID=33097 RepID=A0A150G4A9_GONPE|nr:hypothetical protein GPECTOR_63g42 [Gonium pectorale]|eukprot:KXZ44716.1 hypothetical protein GPECTOR_63g42 [Gonium pectorale]
MLRYGASVGDPTSSNDVPIFVASWTLVAAGAIPRISSWVLGWSFEAGERLLSSRDVFSDAAGGGGGAGGGGPAPGPVGPSSTGANVGSAVLNSVILQEAGRTVFGAPRQDVAVIGNSTLNADGAQLTFSLVGRKGPSAAAVANASSSGPPASAPAPFAGPASAPLRVAPTGSVFFNNMHCVPLTDLVRLAQEAASRNGNTGGGSGGSSGSANATAQASSPPATTSVAVAAPLISQIPRVLEPVAGDGSGAGLGDGQGSGGGGGVVVGNASRGRPSGQGSSAAAAAADGSAAAGGDSSSSAAFFATSFTQMYLRISNIGSRRNIDLSTVQVQYWFEGPDPALNPWSGSGGDAGAGADGSSGPPSSPPFQLFCSDTTPQLRGGCSSLLWAFRPGLPGVQGARYVLALSFAPGAGALRPVNDTAGTGNASAAAPPPSSLPDGTPLLSAVEVILSIEPLRFERLDARRDYSFLDTPLLDRTESVPPGAPPPGSASAGPPGNGSITAPAPAPAPAPGSPASSTADDDEAGGRRVVLRERQPNPRIPAYVQGVIAWGSPPSPASQPVPQSRAPQTSAPLGVQLPAGSSCNSAGPAGGLSCGVSMLYCCSAADGPVVTEVPPNWQDWFRTLQSQQNLQDDIGEP